MSPSAASLPASSAPASSAAAAPAALTEALAGLATPVAWADGSGRVQGANPAFARWLGVSLRRLAELPLPALEAEGERLRPALATLTAGHEPLRLPRLALAWPGLSARYADVWLSPRDGGGTWLEAHPVAEFIAGDAEAALPGALAASLRGLAHELRNPLAGLKGAAQLLARRMDGAESRELLAVIEAEVARLTALLDRLLTPQAARAHARLNIHGVLERVVQLAAHDAGWAVRLVRDYDPSLPELDGDADALVQAVWNLVRNAFEAGAGSVTLSTRIEHEAALPEGRAPALRLDVVDDGRGVPEALAEHLFLPLVSGRADGSGLGLALSQQVARQHRGLLGFRSRPGHTVFSLRLPLPMPDNDDDDDHAATTSAAVTPSRAGAPL